jgi:hypothetical protein
VLLTVVAPTVLLAHGDAPHSINAPRAFSPWDLAVLGCLLVSGTLYLLGAVKLARRSTLRASSTPRAPLAVPALPARVARWEPVAFAIGWGTLVIAVLPPLDSDSIQFFSVHMIQHELMMLGRRSTPDAREAAAALHCGSPRSTSPFCGGRPPG